MLRKIGLPLLALAGLAIGVFMIFFSAKKPPVQPVLFPPASSPYKHFVAGEGIIESAYKNISIGASFMDLITNVYVKVGDFVKQGTPLFKLDTRSLEARLKHAQQELAFAQTDYENKTTHYSFYQRLKQKSAVSEQDYSTAFYDMQLAKQRLETAKAAVNIIKTDIERSTSVAPIDGEVLQVNIRVGQYANVNPFDKLPLIVFGDTSIYHLRIDVDEEDAWRVIMGAPATAFLRGNAKISIPLEFVYSEPYVIPKESLSGADTERVDTRVLQVVYKFRRDQLPVYAGQLLDVYLEAKPSGVAS